MQLHALLPPAHAATGLPWPVPRSRAAGAQSRPARLAARAAPTALPGEAWRQHEDRAVMAAPAPAAPAALPGGWQHEDSRAVMATIRGNVRAYSAGQTALVPLLCPERTGLPFAASLELVQPCSGGEQCGESLAAQQGDELMPSLDGQQGDELELLYVLSGAGELVEHGTGRAWRLDAGVSALCWANAARLVAAPQHAAAQPLAVLKLHLPSALLRTDKHRQSALEGADEPGSARGSSASAQHPPAVMRAPAAWRQLVAEGQAGVLGSAEALRLIGPAPIPAQRPSRPLGAQAQAAATSTTTTTTTTSAAASRTASTPAHQPLSPISLPATFAAAGGWDSGTPEQPGSGGGQTVLFMRSMEELRAYQFPHQHNQLALLLDEEELSQAGLSLSFGVEVFTPGHVTPLHKHRVGHEFFFILAGQGDAHCDGKSFPVSAGDLVCFPPLTMHGLDNPYDSKLYALQMMVPDDEFVAYVQSGKALDSLDDEDICKMTGHGC